MESTVASNGRNPNEMGVDSVDSALTYNTNSNSISITHSNPANLSYAENGIGSPSSFEFHKGVGERGGLMMVSSASMMIRPALLNGHRFGPSKWDDAEKWVASKPKHTPAPATPPHPSSTVTISSSKQSNIAKCGSDYYSSQCGPGAQVMSHHGVVNMAGTCKVDQYRQYPHDDHDTSSRDVIPSSNFFAFPSPPTGDDEDDDNDDGVDDDEHGDHDDDDDDEVSSFDFFPVPEDSTYNNTAPKEVGIVSPQSSHCDDPSSKPAKPLAWDRASSYGLPPSALLSVSMRDMGTEMTPIASQEPSQAATPIQATTPTMNSPVSSAPSTPRRDPIPSHSKSKAFHGDVGHRPHHSVPGEVYPNVSPDIGHISNNGNEASTKRDDEHVHEHGQQDNVVLRMGRLDSTSDHNNLHHHLDDNNRLLHDKINTTNGPTLAGRVSQDYGKAAASMVTTTANQHHHHHHHHNTGDDEDGDEGPDSSSKLLKNLDLEEVKRSVLETRAIAWEEAEQAKYMAKFKREEAKILAWENHQKAKAEAEMRRIEVKLERIRCTAQEKMMSKIAYAKRKGEERRAAADARREEQGARTSEYAQHIRRTGRMPSFLGCAFGPY